MQVPLLDLKPQFSPLRDDVLAEVTAIIDSQMFILGPKVETFEREVCRFTGANHAVGMSSGTDALLAALMALEIGPGDAVVTTPYTFFATAGCISRLGATPVFIDIEPSTYNIAPDLLHAFFEKQCQFDEDGHPATPGGQRIKAIVPVHLFGLCADMDRILAIAAEYDLPVIEDAAQALGTDYPSPARGVVRAGAIGDMGCYSFFPAKNLGCFGDGGMTVCRDEEMAERLRVLRNHGMAPQYYHKLVGGNFRLDALQAAVLSLKLPHLDGWSAGRRRNAARYRELFASSGLDQVLGLPTEPYAASEAPNHHIYNQFVVRAPKRDELIAHLKKNGIGHAIYYPVPLHLQECFADLGYKEGDFPESERAARETLALPIFAELTGAQQERVVEVLREFYR